MLPGAASNWLLLLYFEPTGRNDPGRVVCRFRNGFSVYVKMFYHMIGKCTIKINTVLNQKVIFFDRGSGSG